MYFPIREFLFICLGWNVGTAQFSQSPIPATPSTRAFTPASALEDVRAIFTSPLRLSKNDGLALLSFTAVTSAFILVLDERIDEEYAIEDHVFPYQPIDELAELGRWYDRVRRVPFTAGVSGALALGGLLSKDRELLKTSALVLESIAITNLITVTAKNVFGRARPYTGRGAHDFNLLAFRNMNDEKSIPSGHTSSIFAMMTVIAERHPAWWVKASAYTFALSVAFERMDSRNHWTSDVLVGGALGYLVGRAIAQRYAPGPQRLRARPSLQASALGLVLSW